MYGRIHHPRPVPRPPYAHTAYTAYTAYTFIQLYSVYIIHPHTASLCVCAGLRRLFSNVPPTRYYGTVELNSDRVGRDAGKIAEEVISHLSGIVDANVTVTMEIEAQIPGGTPDTVVRIVTENGQTLKFKNQGFEKD